MSEATILKGSPKIIDLTKLDFETLEAFFPSEHPTQQKNKEENEGSEDEFVRRRRFFLGS